MSPGSLIAARAAEQMVRFGVFQFDPGLLRLLRDGAVVRIGQQPAQVLAALLEQPGVIVSREELRQRLWGSDVFVDFDHGLNKSIQKLRDVLCDRAAAPLYIETVPRVGYRFIAPIEPSLPSPETLRYAGPVLLSGQVAAEAFTPSGSVVPSPWSILRPLLTLVCMLAVACLAWLGLRSRVGLPQPIRSLAVLPFENLSSDPAQEYFVEGMTDELTTSLVRIPSLRVVSRNSAVGTGGVRKSVAELARELGVDAVVEGSVLHSGHQVRINAQLIDLRQDRNLWAQSFDGVDTDTLSVQRVVANSVAHAARLTLVPSATFPPRIDPAAHDAYLRGRYFFNKQDPLHAAQCFEHAIAVQPDYASAYAGLASALDMGTTYGLGTPADLMPRARAAAQRAIQLDPEDGAAYTAIGSIQTIYDWNFPEAERNLLRGLALNPSDSLAEMAYAVLLDATNRPGQAVTHMQHALELDPLSFFITRRLAATLYLARRYDEALARFRTAAEMEGNVASIEVYLNMIYRAEGAHDQAVAHDLAAINALDPGADVATLQAVYQREGWQQYLRARSAAGSALADGNCAAYGMAVDYVALGEREHAFQQLNQAVERRCFRVVWIGIDPLLDPLRTDPRFTSLLHRLTPNAGTL